MKIYIVVSDTYDGAYGVLAKCIYASKSYDKCKEFVKNKILNKDITTAVSYWQIDNEKPIDQAYQSYIRPIELEKENDTMLAKYIE